MTAAETAAESGVVVMDYDGNPVSIENGEMLWWYPDDGERWNSETCQFETPEEDEEDYLDEPEDYDNWLCDPPRQRRESAWDEEYRYFHSDLL